MIKKYKDLNIAAAVSVLLIAAGFLLLYYIHSAAAYIFLFISAVILIMFLAVTYRRIKTIHNMFHYLDAVSSGIYDLDISDNKEGELSIIKNSLYKIVVTLRSQKELILKDRNYLADSLADISHQLKTPITSITMMTDLLKYEKNEEKRHEFIEVIDSQLSRVNWLIITLLKISKIDAGTVTFKNKRENLKNILENAVKPFALTAEMSGIELKMECDGSIFIEADKNWYTEAVSNIVKNCIEHTPNGGYVTVSANETPLFTRIIIRDNGTGISKEDLPHIFERFYHGKNHSESRVGIGLALSKAIFNNQNSIVNVSSIENCGTEFEIVIYKVIV